jgi:hypothetical protein
VSFEQGAYGHTIGRVLCSLPEIYWYTSSENGKCPWNLPKNKAIRQREIAIRHFDRIMPNGHLLPPTWDYVKNFVPDRNIYYNDFFLPQFEKANGVEYLNMYKLLYCTHSLPMELLEQFPNSTVINVIADVEATVNRYMKTSAKFPAYLKLKWMNGESTEYGKFLKSVSEQLRKNFTIQDLWYYQTSKSFEDSVHNTIKTNMQIRKAVDHKNVLTVTPKDYVKMKHFIRSRSVDP